MSSNHSPLTSPSARALAASLRQRGFSCRELMQDCLARIERLNPKVTAHEADRDMWRMAHGWHLATPHYHHRGDSLCADAR